MSADLTAFPHTAAKLRKQFAAAELDRESLRRPLERCDLAVCQGMCCHDGIYLEDDEAEVLAALAVTEADFFHALGLRLPRSVIVEGSFRGLVQGPKTATVSCSWRDRVANYPAHFTDTACCFLVADGRCGLQVLSESRGKHRWHFKPTGCWLHPLTLERPWPSCIGLEDEASDPFRLPGYDGFVTRTQCGRRCATGAPAAETLREELDFLSALLGRSW